MAELAYSPADVRRIAAEGKFAVAISPANAYPLGSEMSQIDEGYKRGVRIFDYVHAGQKLLGASFGKVGFTRLETH